MSDFRKRARELGVLGDGNRALEVERGESARKPGVPRESAATAFWDDMSGVDFQRLQENAIEERSEVTFSDGRARGKASAHFE